MFLAAVPKTWHLWNPYVLIIIDENGQKKNNGIWRRLLLVMNILPQLSFQMSTWNFKCAIFWYHFCAPTISPFFKRKPKDPAPFFCWEPYGSVVKTDQKRNSRHFSPHWWKISNPPRSMALDQYKSCLKWIKAVRFKVYSSLASIIVCFFTASVLDWC